MSFLQCWTYNHVAIIAEAGVNHNGSMSMAKELIDGAKFAGADAVKFQLFDPNKLTAKSAPMAQYQQERADAGNQSQKDLLASLVLKPAQFAELAEYATQQGILFLCTPFDIESAEFLVHELGVPCLKLSSGEVTNLPMLRALSALNTPVLLSSGMANLAEVQAAVEGLQSVNPIDIGLFHCVSAYPAPLEAINLKAMQTMAEAFPQFPVGYSDHSLGLTMPIAAVALGARLIEKHLTLDTALPGPDHAASLTIDELADMVRDIRVVEAALGSGVKTPHACEQDCIAVARRSLVAARDLPKGHILSLDDIVAKRPGTGISPMRIDELIGVPLPEAIAYDTLFPVSLLDEALVVH